MTPARRPSDLHIEDETAVILDPQAHLDRLVRALLNAGDEFKVLATDQPAILKEVLARQDRVWQQVRGEAEVAMHALLRAREARDPTLLLIAAGALAAGVLLLLVADVVNWPWRSLRIGDAWVVIASVAGPLVVVLLNAYAVSRDRRRRLLLQQALTLGQYTTRVDAEIEMLLRFVLNERAGDAASHGSLLSTNRAPTLVELNGYRDVVPSRTYRSLKQFIRQHRTSAVGLAGPRGAGKTTAMLSILRDPDIGCVGIHLPTPVYYEPGEYLRLIELRLAQEVLGDEGVEPGMFPKLLRDSPARIIRAALAGTLWPVVLLGACLVLALDNATMFVPTMTVSLITLMAGMIGAVALTSTIRLVWRYLARRGRRLRAASPAARLAYDRLMDLRWQAAIKRTAKTTGRSAWLTGEASSEVAHTQRELSHPENVEGVRRFLAQVAELTGQPVIVCVDELDKIADAQQAVDLVNALKDLFHIEGVHFIVSVSTDAMHSFAARGVPVRDVFDSSLDTVISIARLSWAESRALLDRRVLYFPDAAAAYCHAWSGGHARDLIRTARAMIDASRDATTAVPVINAVDSIVRADVAETLEAAYGTLPEGTDIEFRVRLVELTHLVRRPSTDLAETITEHLPSVTAAADAPAAPALLRALAPYLLLAANVWRVFTVPRSPRQWADRNSAIDITDTAEALATARWVLATRPVEAAMLLADNELRTLVERNRHVGPARPDSSYQDAPQVVGATREAP
ncbi:P-loop NTPase fold protein [Micromonospora tarensis]|uniref:AAA+ ATPase domain-containing protein n=1 Tax=Micromonospora tarensis TaxID=2806100 RepID=A0ABS1YCA7_9ACTN|nr:P-loop NTPase fold protein [Micromonospora tarensis]MBM0275047.1 hypothetical protein [Micromonospora tarensis]